MPSVRDYTRLSPQDRSPASLRGFDTAIYLFCTVDVASESDVRGGAAINLQSGKWSFPGARAVGRTMEFPHVDILSPRLRIPLEASNPRRLPAVHRGEPWRADTGQSRVLSDAEFEMQSNPITECSSPDPDQYGVSLYWQSDRAGGDGPSQCRYDLVSPENSRHLHVGSIVQPARICLMDDAIFMSVSAQPFPGHDTATLGRSMCLGQHGILRTDDS